MFATTERFVEPFPIAPARTSVSIIEDDSRCRAALARRLSYAGFEVESHPSAEGFLESLHHKEWDCVVAGIHLPGMNGLQLQAEIKRSRSCTQMVFFTGRREISGAVQVMREGAVDCLEKPIDDQRLLDAVTRASELSQRKRAERSKRVELEQREKSLTPREREVFALVTEGLLNKQVGATLGATERTIKTHRGRVMDKMNASSLAELVRMAELLQVRSGTNVTFF